MGNAKWDVIRISNIAYRISNYYTKLSTANATLCYWTYPQPVKPANQALVDYFGQENKKERLSYDNRSVQA